MSTADAVARETAWLQQFGDGLPALLTANGGSWDIIGAYWRRTPPKEKTRIDVLRSTLSDERSANIRIRSTYEFTLKLHWPVRQTGTSLAETEQQALDNAVELLLQRIRGPLLDKTHGGRFLSVGEVPRMPGVHVVFEDPEITIPAVGALKATVSYAADDFEIND